MESVLGDKNARVIRALASVSEKTARKLIDGLTYKMVKVLTNVASEAAAGNYTLTPEQRDDMDCYARDIQELIKTKTKQARRRQILRRKGVLRSILNIATHSL